MASLPGVFQTDVAVSGYDRYAPDERATLDVVRAAEDYLPAIAARLREHDEAGRRFDLCLFNAGMDPCERCAEGGLPGITDELLAAREALVFDWCARGSIPIAFVLAGGYTGPRLDEAGLVALHRLTIAEGARRARPATPGHGAGPCTFSFFESTALPPPPAASRRRVARRGRRDSRLPCLHRSRRRYGRGDERRGRGQGRRGEGAAGASTADGAAADGAAAWSRRRPSSCTRLVSSPCTAASPSSARASSRPTPRCPSKGTAAHIIRRRERAPPGRADSARAHPRGGWRSTLDDTLLEHPITHPTAEPLGVKAGRLP